MPFRINGIGTTLLGARDFRADGTYTTMEWVTFLFIPLIPFRGLRIRPVDKPGLQSLVGSWKCLTIEKSRPNLRQVLSVYGWCALLMCSFWPQSQWVHRWCGVPIIAVLALPWYLRRRARQKLLTTVERAQLGLISETIN
jgi:hypothetical protein